MTDSPWTDSHEFRARMIDFKTSDPLVVIADKVRELEACVFYQSKLLDERDALLKELGEALQECSEAWTDFGKVPPGKTRQLLESLPAVARNPKYPVI